MLAALATFFAGFSRLSLLAAPYALAVVAAVWRWSRGHETNMPRSLLRAGQLYAGLNRSLRAPHPLLSAFGRTCPYPLSSAMYI